MGESYYQRDTEHFNLRGIIKDLIDHNPLKVAVHLQDNIVFAFIENILWSLVTLGTHFMALGQRTKGLLAAFPLLLLCRTLFCCWGCLGLCCCWGCLGCCCRWGCLGCCCCCWGQGSTFCWGLLGACCFGQGSFLAGCLWTLGFCWTFFAGLGWTVLTGACCCGWGLEAATWFWRGGFGGGAGDREPSQYTSQSFSAWFPCVFQRN